MSEKRRALGRGLGLIPASPGTDRPIDVFFQDSQRGRHNRVRSVPEPDQRQGATQGWAGTPQKPSPLAIRPIRPHPLQVTPTLPVPGATFRELPSTPSVPTLASRARSSTRTTWASWSTRSGRSVSSSRLWCAPAGRRGCRARRHSRTHHGRAALARLERRAKPSQPSSRPPRTTTCFGTPSSRTFTAANSTPWRRQRHTSSCSTTSAAPRRSWPPGSDAPARRSPTPCACSNSAAGRPTRRRRSPLGRSRPCAARSA
jgi:hypothetical protein